MDIRDLLDVQTLIWILHGCVGKAVARMEGEVVLGALARDVGGIELDGEPRRLLNNTIRSFENLPVIFHAP